MSDPDDPEGAADADAEGNWQEVLTREVRGPPRPALFLDRDGVLVEEVNFLHRPEHLRLVPGAGKALAEMGRRGWRLVVVTNQSGIGRGYYGWDEFRAVQARLVARLAEDGAALDAVFACPFFPDGQGLYRRVDHPWRKPAPGMILAAARQLPIDLARSWMVGDRERDARAARAAGLAGAVHVLTGYGKAEREAAERLGTDRFAVKVVDSIAEVPAAFARRRHGMSRLRIASALGVVVLVVAAVWLWATQTIGDKPEQAAREMRTIDGNIQALYAGKQRFAGADAAANHDATAALVRAGVFPKEMLSGPDAAQPMSPWGTKVRVFTSRNGYTDAYQIAWFGDGGTPVAIEYCTAFLGRLAGLFLPNLIDLYAGPKAGGTNGYFNAVPPPEPSAFATCSDARTDFELAK